MSGMLGGYGFPVLHAPRPFAGFGQFGADPVPTHNAVQLVHYTPGVPPVHDTAPATAGEPFSVVQLAADVPEEPVIQLAPDKALAQVRAWASEPWSRISDSAYIATPPPLLQATRWAFGAPSSTVDAVREFELTLGVQFGPQPALAAFVSEHEAKVASAAIVLAAWQAEAPGLPSLGPGALDDPAFRQAVVDLQHLAWTLRQVKRLRGLSLERRLLATGSGADWAWIFANEAGGAFGWGGGYVHRVRTVLAPPTALVAQQLDPVVGRTADLEQRLQAARVAAGRPATPILPAGTFGYVPTALIVGGLLFGAWWLFQRHRGRAAAPALGWGGGGGGGSDDILRDVTPTAKIVGSANGSFLPAATFD